MELGINFNDLVEVGNDSPLTFEAEKSPEEKKDVDIKNDNKDTTVVDEDLDITKFFENSIKDGEDPEIKDDEEIDENVKAPSQKIKVEDKSNDKSKADDSSSQVPFFLFKSLSEEGALTSFNEEDFNKDIEENGLAVAVQNAWEREADAIRQSVRNEHEEDFKEYAELKDLGIDTDTAKKLVASKIQFDTIKDESLEGEENVDLRKEILFQNFKNNTKLADTKINKLIEKIVDSGDDEEEAKEALKEIKEYNKLQIENVKKEKIEEEKKLEGQRKEVVKKYKTFIDGLDEPVKGYKINKNTKTKLENNVMSGYIWNLRKEDPVKFDTLITWYAMNGALDGKFDKATKIGRTEAIKKLEDILGTSGKKTVNPITGFDKETEVDDDAMLNGLAQVSKAVSKFK